jgi:hypothetical protein
VHRLVLDQFLEDRRRRAQVDPFERQKPAVEPRVEETHQIRIDADDLVSQALLGEQRRAHFHQRGRSAWRQIEPAKQLSRGDSVSCRSQELRLRRLGRVGARRVQGRLRIRGELAGEQQEEARALRRVQVAIRGQRFARERQSRVLALRGEQCMAELDQPLGLPALGRRR